MIPLILSAMFAVHLGPMSPDTPAREPQLAANASTVVLAFGAGKAIYFSSSQDHGKTFSKDQNPGIRVMRLESSA